jgi:hypothetical protein
MLEKATCSSVINHMAKYINIITITNCIFLLLDPEGKNCPSPKHLAQRSTAGLVVYLGDFSLYLSAL